MTERLWHKIGEAAQLIGVTPKELRYWERVIPELKPRRSQGNLRYYHVDELPRLQKIRNWLAEGLTVADCRQLLLTGQLARTLDLGLDEPEPVIEMEIEPPAPPKKRKTNKTASRSGPKSRDLAELKPVIDALKSIVVRLSKPPRV